MYQRNPFNHKISVDFANRLSNLQPQQKVRVIVFLHLDNGKSCGARQSPAERKAAIESLRNSAKNAFEYILNIIKDFGGQPLTENPGALGQIPIEICAAGVNALAESDMVKAVLEDQIIEPGDGTESHNI
ncbi:hypothetical protein NIES4071_75460 [Calothrix sp. NIES-4071]|nr:hypothetical protein NIES4071_75460 [Calothrix sp. NIES-4071]BAZ61821.1 hypothetical protein NIES4105_75410 [Calothrix sp. NIES-4105]